MFAEDDVSARTGKAAVTIENRTTPRDLTMSEICIYKCRG
jgi:hypothetical protein